MDLTFKNNFIIEEEIDKVTAIGKLRCSCDSEQFKIFHTGKQTRGILDSYITKTKKIFYYR